MKRNAVRGAYDPEKAHAKACVRRHHASYRGKKIAEHAMLRDFVDGATGDGQSPEAIAGRLKHQERHLPYVSKNTIIRYLDSPHGALIGVKWKRKLRRGSVGKSKKLSDRVFIDKRPKIVESRKRVGDTEADFIVSGKSGAGVLLSVVCRKLRVVFLELVTDVSIDEVHTAFERVKERFPEMKTITLDNDILFRMHKTLAKLLSVKIYFCHPYHSWEKGSVENANRAIRKYIPKGSNLSKYDSEFIQGLEDHLNGRFMKCLKYKTPREVLDAYRKTKKTAWEAAKCEKVRCSD